MSCRAETTFCSCRLFMVASGPAYRALETCQRLTRPGSTEILIWKSSPTWQSESSGQPDTIPLSCIKSVGVEVSTYSSSRTTFCMGLETSCEASQAWHQLGPTASRNS